MNFGQSTLSGLYQGNAVLCVLGSSLKTGNLSSHLFRNGQTSGIVACAVDLVTGGQFLQVLGNRRVVVA